MVMYAASTMWSKQQRQHPAAVTGCAVPAQTWELLGAAGKAQSLTAEVYHVLQRVLRQKNFTTSKSGAQPCTLQKAPRFIFEHAAVSKDKPLVKVRLAASCREGCLQALLSNAGLPSHCLGQVFLVGIALVSLHTCSTLYGSRPREVH